MKLLVTILMFLQLSVKAQEIRKMNIGELENYIQTRSQPAVFNFWATWCAPCIEEMPSFNKIVGQNKNIELVFVSVDNEKAFPETIRMMVNKKKIHATVIWLNETNADVFCPRIDKKWEGSIPASLFINHKNSYRKFIESQLSPAELRKELRLMSRK